MLTEGSASIVSKVERNQLNNHHIEVLVFHDGRAVVLSSSAIGIYRDRTSVLDPLGNGLINLVEIPQAYCFQEAEAPWVQEHRAGFVRLHNGMSLLILPNDIRLYRNNNDALHNTNPIITIGFEAESG